MKNLKSRLWKTSAVIFLMALTLEISAFGQTSSVNTRKLSFGKSLERKITTGDEHRYKLTLRQGQVLSVELQESDINLKIELIAPTDNQSLATADLGIGFERETLTFIAQQSDQYLLTVTLADKESGRGRYSLRARLINSATEKERTHILAERLLTEAVALKKKGTPDKMREAIAKREEALALWQSLGERFWESHTLKKLGESHYALFEFGKAMDYLDRSLPIIKELGDKKTEAATLQWMGTVMANAGDRQKANDYFNESLQSLKREKNKLGEAILLYSLGSNAFHSGDKPKAMEYYNQALPLIQKEGNKGWEASVLLGLGQEADSQDEKQKAIDMYDRALALWREVKNEEGEGLALQYRGKVYLAQGDAQKALGSLNQALSSFQKALESFDRALSSFQSAKNKIGEALTFSDIGRAYERMEKVEEAIEAIKESLVSFQGFENKPFEISWLGIIGSLYNSIGKYEEAIKYAELVIATEEIVPEGTAESQKKNQESGMKRSKALSQQAIGVAYYNLGDREKALLYYHRALAAFEQDEASKRMAWTTLRSIGQIYRQQYEMEKALGYYERALSLARESDGKSGIVSALNAIGGIYLDRSEYGNALKRFEQVLEVIREIKPGITDATDLGFIKRVEAGALNNLALVYDNLGEPRKALDRYNQSLAIYKDTADKDEEAGTLLNISGVYSSQGDYQEALKYVRLAQETFSQASPMIKASMRARGMEARFLQRLGSIAWNSGNFREALDYNAQALSMAERDGLKDLESSIRNTIGLVYADSGELRKSLEFFRQSREISKAIEDKEGEIVTLINIAKVIRDMGEMQEALKLLNQALDLAKAIQNKKQIASSLFNIGQLYSWLDETGEALNHYDQALSLHREMGDKQGESLALGDTGFVYSNMGERQKALDLFKQALAIIGEVGDKKNEAVLLGNIGTIYFNLGENRTALDYNDRSLRLAQSIGDKQTQATKLGMIGHIQLASGERQKALASLEEALALCRENEYKLVESGVLISLGEAHSESADKQKALRLFDESLELARKHSDRWNEIRALSSMGKVHLEMGEAQKAIDSYNRSLLIAREIGNREGEAKALRGLMSAWKARGNTQLAIFYGKQSVNKYQELRGSIRNLKRETQIAYREKVTDAYRELADSLIDAGLLPEAERVLAMLKQQEAFEFVQRDAGEADLLSKNMDFDEREREAMAEYARLSDDLVARSRRRDTLDSKSDRSPDEEAEYQRLKKEVDDAAEGIRSFFKKTEAEFTKKTDTEGTIGAKEIERLSADLRRVGPGVILISTYLLPQRYRAILNTGKTLIDRKTEYKPLDLDGEKVNRKIMQFKRDLQNPNADPRHLGKELYDIFVKPLEKDIESAKAKTILWSLDGSLRYIPVAALYDGNRYLAERYQNVIVTLGQMTTTFNDPPREGWRVLGMGVSKQHEGFIELRAVVRELKTIVRDERDSQESEGVLPGIRLLDEEFTARSFARSLKTTPDGKTFNLGHLATHFILGSNRYNSVLLLGDGTMLSLYDMGKDSDFDFANIELLTLSACETGVTVGGDGDEVESLGMIAQEKGAKAIVASLWKVADESTAVLMSEFYRLRRENPKLTKSEAMQRAQRAMLQGGYKTGETPLWRRGAVVVGNDDNQSPAFKRDENAPYAHPYFWSPFILIGNWR